MKYYDNPNYMQGHYLSIYKKLIRPWMLTEFDHDPTNEEFIKMLAFHNISTVSKWQNTYLLFEDRITWTGESDNQEFASVKILIRNKPSIQFMNIEDEQGLFANSYYNTIKRLPFFSKVTLNGKECYFIKSQKTAIVYTKNESTFGSLTYGIGMTRLPSEMLEKL